MPRLRSASGIESDLLLSQVLSLSFSLDSDALDAFENDIFTHGGPSAFPPDRSQTVLPSRLFFGWTDKSLDGFMYDNMHGLSA